MFQTRRHGRTAAWGLLGALAAACQTGWHPDDQAGLTHMRRVLQPDADGQISFTVPVASSHDALLLTLRTADGDTAFFHRLRRPSGGAVLDAQAWWDVPLRRQDSVFPTVDPTLVWPAAPGDEPLTPGDWTVEARVEGVHGPVIAEATLRPRAPETERALRVVVWLDQDLVPTDPAWVHTDQAVAFWRDELFGPFGVNLQVEVRQHPLPALLPDPADDGAELYDTLSWKVPLDTLNVVIGDAIDGQAPERVRGRSGGLPGPLAPSRRRAVVVALDELSGADDTLDAGDVPALAQTLAHEVGHFLGLFHPAEPPCADLEGQVCDEDVDPVTAWDALPDTEDCTTWVDCMAALGDNLMFPHTLCETPGEVSTCREQHGLTEDQLTVLMRHAAYH